MTKQVVSAIVLFAESLIHPNTRLHDRRECRSRLAVDGRRLWHRSRDGQCRDPSRRS
jgi:hypothetical protein